MSDSEPAEPGLSSPKLETLDQIIGIAWLLEAGEAGYARDNHAEILAAHDTDGRKLDAFVVGALDALSFLLMQEADVLPLLVYMIELYEGGPGGDALKAARRRLRSLARSEHLKFTETGRGYVSSLYAGELVPPGAYARLLVSEADQGHD